MDVRSNLVLRAIALATDIEEIEADARGGLPAGERGGVATSPRVALDRLGHVKHQLAGLRRRAGDYPPPELQEASKALGRAEKGLSMRCRRREERTGR